MEPATTSQNLSLLTPTERLRAVLGAMQLVGFVMVILPVVLGITFASSATEATVLVGALLAVLATGFSLNLNESQKGVGFAISGAAAGLALLAGLIWCVESLFFDATEWSSMFLTVAAIAALLSMLFGLVRETWKFSRAERDAKRHFLVALFPFTQQLWNRGFSTWSRKQGDVIGEEVKSLPPRI